MSPHPRTAGSVAGPPAHAPCPANPTAAHAARSANLPQRPPGCHRLSPQDILIARRGSTVKLALMGMPPEGVLAVVCLDNPRDNTRGKALWASLPSLGPQEECPIGRPLEGWPSTARSPRKKKRERRWLECASGPARRCARRCDPIL